MSPVSDAERKRINDLADRIVGCAYTVANTLGSGFLEKVYENALAHELRKAKLAVEQQHPVKVHYDGVIVGDYAADLLVERTILVELKAAQGIDDVHKAQCMNYLKAGDLKMCILINFGRPRMEFLRIVMDF
jgi:GxxExxY protein